MSALTSLATSKVANELLLPQAFAAGLELLVNKALLLNKNKYLPINSVLGKTLTLDIAELTFPLSFTMNAQTSRASQTKIVVSSLTEASDCTIVISINILKKLKADHQITQLIKQGELDVLGDVKVAQQFATIGQSLEIDWQSEIAKYIGDVPTHKILQYGNKVTKGLIKHSAQLNADMVEYIVHEKRLVVTNSQIKRFNQQVIAVSEEVDRVSDRINKLSSELSNYK
jgi:ubiquinone biosynthesis protein UbiJ